MRDDENAGAHEANIHGRPDANRAEMTDPQFDRYRPRGCRRVNINISLSLAIGDRITIRQDRLIYLGRTHDGRLAFSKTRLVTGEDPTSATRGGAHTVFYDEPEVLLND